MCKKCKSCKKHKKQKCVKKCISMPTSLDIAGYTSYSTTLSSSDDPIDIIIG